MLSRAWVPHPGFGYPTCMSTLADKARAADLRYAMLPTSAPVLAMVSGGGDSVALLRLLAAGELGEHPLRVLHVNHGLREDASEGDESFVRELCDHLAVECRVMRYDVGAYAVAEKLNLEDAGRRIRYRFANEELDAWCGELGVEPERGRIAVAHTRDDRVETFLMRAITGGGTGSLAGIAPVRGRIVRPLIGCDRAEVRAWLDAGGAGWREDESNSDTARMRAYVRERIVPQAAALNPAFRETLARTMDLLADDDEVLSSTARERAREYSTVEPGERVMLQRAPLLALGRPMARRTVREALIGCFPEASRLESAHVEALVDGLADDAFARDLPEGLRAMSEYDSMVILRREGSRIRVAPGLLPLPGTTDLGPAGMLVAGIAERDDRSGEPCSIVIDVAAVGGELVVDGWREGDRMQPLGMMGTRKLSDMLIDAKVPERLRQAVPVVRDGDRIVWLAGVRMAEQYRVTGSTARAMRLTWKKGFMEPAS
ncbi:MAG: tRNA lysidine(34) synthetase TilS [Actinobacteria bacterium HGW-Actinobacteria-7]|nr:MAG: tRNA lysidine(34) synthetase TilS [Actinobacteria bacterium HGW-Actinobacteria-7]